MRDLMCRARAGMWIYAAVIAIAACSIGVIGWQLRVQNERIDEVSDENRAAICALRGDLERRVASGEEFLRDNPEGIPGIPRSTIELSLEGQRATIRVLAFVECE